MKNKDGSKSKVKFKEEVLKKGPTNVKTKPKKRQGMVSDAYKQSLADALAKSARKVKGLNRLSNADISRQFSIARKMVSPKFVKDESVAKGFAQDKAIRAKKAKGGKVKK